MVRRAGVFISLSLSKYYSFICLFYLPTVGEMIYSLTAGSYTLSCHYHCHDNKLVSVIKFKICPTIAAISPLVTFWASTPHSTRAFVAGANKHRLRISHALKRSLEVLLHL